MAYRACFEEYKYMTENDQTKQILNFDAQYYDKKNILTSSNFFITL
jgi:hypothetical protein